MLDSVRPTAASTPANGLSKAWHMNTSAPGSTTNGSILIEAVFGSGGMGTLVAPAEPDIIPAPPEPIAVIVPPVVVGAPPTPGEAPPAVDGPEPPAPESTLPLPPAG